jgi:integrase/recombinase XerD
MGVYRDAMDQEMARRGYAPRTRETYLRSMERLVRFCRRRPDQIEADDFRRYLTDLADVRGLSPSSFNQAVAAGSVLFRGVLKREWDDSLFERQSPRYSLPVVLNADEVRRLFAVVSNPRDRALLELAYGAGLRLGEVLNLKVSDIDSQRMTIRIEQGKGRKDRYVMLSPTLLETLRTYWRACRPRTWLFPGQDEGGHLDPTAAQRMIILARLKARIEKKASFHTLRHSFATQLLERGTNVRVIQALLGHRSLHATERYTHVAGNYLRETVSPLDELRLKNPGKKRRR